MKELSLEEYRALWKKSIDDPEGFWLPISRELKWIRGPSRALSYISPSSYTWFPGGRINIAENSLRCGDKIAITWYGEEEGPRKISYNQLRDMTLRIANGLRDLKSGDRVMIYMPMIPEAGAAMLASSWLGLIHSVVFSGFGVGALRTRIEDAKPSVIITSEYTVRRGKRIPLKEIAEEAVKGTNVKLITLGRGSIPFERENLDPYPSRSEDPLFILYTSGTTGKPKGVVHNVGSYSVWAYAHVRWLFNLQEGAFLSTSDIGWINGHSYSLYGSLLNGGNVVWYEGAPDFPSYERLWEIMEKERVKFLWTAPTLVRLLMKNGEIKGSYDLKLKIVVTAGELLGSDAYDWLVRNTNAEKVFEVWGQTENSGYIASSGGEILGLLPIKKGSVGLPLPSIDVSVVDEEGNPLPPGKPGYVIVKSPSPAFMTTLWNDRERYLAYYKKFGYYNTGDFGYIDEDGYLYILGRSDDVIKVAGHRIGVAEVEESCHIPEVAEVAAVDVPDQLKGSRIIIYVVPKEGVKDVTLLREKVKENLRQRMGPIADVKDVMVVSKLPHTRTGKVLRRLLREAYMGNISGDVSTIEDESALEEIKKAIKGDYS
ncbi:AMP-binding protein [Sulfuracidifex metallicus]|uniref:AMP-binding protein n=2 Tax=Sulfuracidifex metallicus TaxID=47303 RepID=A0A6A9QP61_SULME|nr:AMP-binding protein [Sulfuracidifex metallicus]MUN29949.1 AMP-binding protein [Sulfuracidifex metallicus DSM 6482 = JCM 9184]WOE51667.1 AMP-binding protein [Sulfuracidifex metallicus DSM 6482 = JCM 9184]